MFFYNNSTYSNRKQNTIKLVFMQNNSGGSNEMDKYSPRQLLQHYQSFISGDFVKYNPPY